jgi:hypothetical protein
MRATIRRERIDILGAPGCPAQNGMRCLTISRRNMFQA